MHIPMYVRNLELVMILVLLIETRITVQIKVPNKDTAVVEKGTHVRLKCSVQLKKPHTSHDLVWYRNGEELQNTTKTTYMCKVKKNNLKAFLIIANADYADSGNYSCGVTGNSSGHNDVTKITVARPFAKVHCKSSNIQEIYCFWNEAFPNLPSKFAFYWKVSFRENFTECVRHKDKIGREGCIYQTDNSCYFPQNYGTSHIMMLKLSNDLGKKTVKLEFDPDTETIPNKPRSVNATTSSSDATVKWSPPSDWKHSYRLMYKTAYKKCDEVSKWIEEVLPYVDNTEKELKGLLPFTKYTFKVACISDYIGQKVNVGNNSVIKWSEWSETVDVTTKEAAPNGRVNFSASPSGLDENKNRVYRVEWKPLSKNEANGIILGYKIYVRQFNAIQLNSILHIQDNDSNTTEVKVISVNVSQKTCQESNNESYSHIVKGLLGDKSYDLDMVAYNSIAESPPASVNIPAVPAVLDTANLGTQNNFDAVLVIPITVGTAILLIICALMSRLVYRKLSLTGFFDTIATVQLPGDPEENNCSVLTRERQAQEISEIYDDLLTHLGEPKPGQADSSTQAKSLLAKNRWIDRNCAYNIAGTSSSCGTTYICSERRDAEYSSERTEEIPDWIGNDDEDSGSLGGLSALQEFIPIIGHDSTDKNNNDDGEIIHLSCQMSESQQSECVAIITDSHHQDSESKQKIHDQFQYGLEHISHDEIVPCPLVVPEETEPIVSNENLDNQAFKSERDIPIHYQYGVEQLSHGEIMPLLSVVPEETECVLANEDLDHKTSKHERDIPKQSEYRLEQIHHDEIMPLPLIVPENTEPTVACEDLDYETSKSEQDIPKQSQNQVERISHDDIMPLPLAIPEETECIVTNENFDCKSSKSEQDIPKQSEYQVTQINQITHSGYCQATEYDDVTDVSSTFWEPQSPNTKHLIDADDNTERNTDRSSFDYSHLVSEVDHTGDNLDNEDIADGIILPPGWLKPTTVDNSHHNTYLSSTQV